jgi:hypothetical protein
MKSFSKGPACTNEGRQMTAGTEEAPSVDADLKIEAVPVDPEQIRKFTSEDEFTELSIIRNVKSGRRDLIAYQSLSLPKGGSSAAREHDRVIIRVPFEPSKAS